MSQHSPSVSPPDYHTQKRIAAEDSARGRGERVVHPRPDELLIDIDSREQYERYLDLFELLQDKLGGDVLVTYNQPSRSKPEGRHVIVKLPFFVGNATRIAFQAALGSDPKRELLSILGHLDGDDKPTVFFEKPL